MSPAKERSIEVTAEDAAAVASSFLSSPQSSSSLGHRTGGHSSTSVAKKLSNFSKKLSLRSPKGGVTNANTNHKNAGAGNRVDRRDISSRPYYNNNGQLGGDSSSFNGEAQSIGDNSSFNGQMSVAQTVASLDTVKISNRNAAALASMQTAAAGGEQHDSKGGSKKTPWKKLKNFMTNNNRKVDKEDYDDHDKDGNHHYRFPQQRSHSKSADFDGTGLEKPSSTTASWKIGNNRKRNNSTDYPTSNNSKLNLKIQHENELREKALLDDAVRGRLDGIDMLSLGPAYKISLERQHQPFMSSNSNNESSTPWEPTPSFSFAGRSTHYSTQQMIDDMLWRPTAGGQEAPHIVLEGFFRDDRWMVTLDVPRDGSARVGSKKSLTAIQEDDTNFADAVPLLQLTDEEEQSHSTSPDEFLIPRHKLWGSMWGADNNPPPKPSHMSSVEDVGESDNILEMAASVSVPIDVDEDTFMISNFQHLQAVHDLAAVPLQHGRFDETMEIFQKILKGVQIQEEDQLRHLEGVTLHNMAVILMWQRKYEAALDCVGKAIKARLQYLPQDHPDIAVSLARQGMCYFALERYSLAVASFQAACELFKEDSVAKAKALLNLGVAKYQSGDDIEALNDFAEALEIQRMWLQGPVKREANVFGAATILGNMGKVHIKRGDYDSAISVYEEALLVRHLYRTCNSNACFSLLTLLFVCFDDDDDSFILLFSRKITK